MDIPKVGVGVIVMKGRKVLMGKRKNAHGEGTWAFPGGHLEFNEAIEDCARREVMEEAGIKIKNIRKGPYTNNLFRKEGKHYITLFILSDYDSGEVMNNEPDRCEGWEWFEWNNLPRPLFLTTDELLERRYTPFDDSKQHP